MSQIVWYAILLYLLGVAVVIYLRPAFMFRQSGLWKEFGLSNQDSYTVLPFWMFAILWAIASYVLVSLGGVFVSHLVFSAQASNTNANAANLVQNLVKPISQAATISLPAVAAATAVGSTEVSNSKLPGYYILENLPTGPRYVYWGPEPPSASNIIVR